MHGYLKNSKYCTGTHDSVSEWIYLVQLYDTKPEMPKSSAAIILLASDVLGAIPSRLFWLGVLQLFCVMFFFLNMFILRKILN